MAPSEPDQHRRILVMAHPGRESAVAAATEMVTGLAAAGLSPYMLPSEAAQLPAAACAVLTIADPADPLDAAELVVVLGGDGTILRAAEVVRGSDVPLLGVNLGHVGFLAEAERDDIAETVQRIAGRQYEVEQRMTLDVEVTRDGQVAERSWALNEVSVEKRSREKMLEVMLTVDERPLTSFGCDGVVMATPTGSTAYAFSAGGPVVWPEVEALLLVPISAHALFSRPLVVAPGSVLGVEVLTRTQAGGVLWCDGRRTVPLRSGDQVQVRRSQVTVRLARLARAPFTDRLVGKFGLPVHGWRGPFGDSSPGAPEVPLSTTLGTPGRS